MNLYRAVSLQELGLIYDSGMKAFPAGLPQQPIFYPVLQLEYARQIAADWNTRNGEFAGYVTQFKVEDAYISRFEEHVVGGSQYQEYWISAEELAEFNKHITGHITIVEASFGDGFQGFIPEKFGLSAKNAVEQFTLLANSFIYKRMDFYLEIRRNHKAIFLNYPFWQKYSFKNPGLKEKILKAIKEAWLTSFPNIPLVNYAPNDSAPVEQTEMPSLEESVDGEIILPEEEDEQSLGDPVQKDRKLSKETKPDPPFDPDQPKDHFLKPTPGRLVDGPVQKDKTLSKETKPNPSIDRDQPEDRLIKSTHERSEEYPVQEDRYLSSLPPKKPMERSDAQVARSVRRVDSDALFLEGVKLGLSGRYEEAIDALTKAVQDDPNLLDAHTSLGVAYQRLGESDRALSCYETALKINPLHAEARYFRANILYSRGDIREAIAEYTLAVGLEPALIDAYREAPVQDRLTDYSSVTAGMHWIAKAAHRILFLNKSLETSNEQAELLKERAVQFYRLWNYERAASDCSSALALKPEDAGTLYLRGLAYEQMGENDRALQDYQQAIEINPGLSDIYINRGIVFAKMGNFRQAVASLTEGVRLAPGNADIYFNRGMSYYQGGDLEHAIDDFSSVIQLSPGDEETYYWRGISNEEIGRQEDAIADYLRFLEISQNGLARVDVEQRLQRRKDSEQGNMNIRGNNLDDR